jgi:hypothetical protein
MKALTLLLTLLTCSVNAQTNFNFYYGSNEALGAEILIEQSFGFGFAGTTEKSKALGEFSTGNRNEYYHKKDKLIFRPMVGLNASYAITKDVGWQIGLDTFNGLNTGLIVYF